MLLGEVAPEVPGLGALALFLISFALVYVAVPLVRLILGGPGNILGAIPIIGGALKAPIKKIEDRTVKWLANKAAAMQGMGVAMFRVWYQVHRDLVIQVAGLAVDTYHGLAGVRAYALRLVGHTGAADRAKAQAAAKVGNPTVTKSVVLQRRWIRARLRELRDYVDASVARAIAAARTGTIRIPFPRIGSLERALGGIKARVGKLDKLLTAAGAAALVAVGIRKLGLNWLRCRNTKRVGRALCGAPAELLELFLGVGAAALLITDVCRIVGIVERGAVALSPVIDSLVLGVQNIICGGPESYPSAIVASDLANVSREPTGIVANDVTL